MSEPDINQDEQDVEGHTSTVMRNQPQDESDTRDDLTARDDDDVAGHGGSMVR
jgi:hypothetical protein